MKLTQEELNILLDAPEGAVRLLTMAPYWDAASHPCDIYVGRDGCEISSGSLPVIGVRAWVVKYEIADLRRRKEQEDKQQPVEWVNGDQCVCDGLPFTFVGIIPDNRCVLIDEDKSIHCVYLCSISKPATKEKRWIVYDGKGRFINQYKGKSIYQHHPHDQIIEIEINV